MFSKIKIMLAALLIAVSSIAIEAANTTHMVKKGETVYGISRIYGISIETLLEHNPSVREGLKEGAILIIPAKDAVDNVSSSQTSTSPDSVNNITPDDVAAAVKSYQKILAVEGDVKSNRQLSIGVLLPFKLKDKAVKSAQRYIEFYKGFLVAADSLSHSGATIKIYAYDTCDNIDSIKSIMVRPEFESLNVVVVPDNESQIALISETAKKNGTYILNMFSIKDESQKTNPWVMQANIPSDKMYEKAFKIFMERYEGYTPVFLSRKDGNSNKRESVNLLKGILNDAGRKYKEITYSTSLPVDSLNNLPGGGKYVFIPLSGTKTEFLKFSSALKAFKNERDGVEEAVKLFGYPDWVTFTNKEKADLCELNTTIYSRFYCSADGSRATDVFQRFKRWYGHEINQKAVPLQGVLGFDTGYFLIKALRASNGDLSKCLFHDGVQTGFDFVRIDGESGGLYNDALYIIEFRPGGFIERVKK